MLALHGVMRLVSSRHINIAHHVVVRRPTMAHSQNGFGLLPPNIATIPLWSESLDKPLRE